MAFEVFLVRIKTDLDHPDTLKFCPSDKNIQRHCWCWAGGLGVAPGALARERRVQILRGRKAKCSQRRGGQGRLWHAASLPISKCGKRLEEKARRPVSVYFPGATVMELRK